MTVFTTRRQDVKNVSFFNFKVDVKKRLKPRKENNATVKI